MRAALARGAALPLGPGGFRLLLALCVLGSHLSRYEIGRPAVCVFFMLSGYWVTRIHAERHAHRRTGNFLLSRLLRIWLPFAPVYLAATLLALALAPRTGPAPEPADLWALALLGTATSHRDMLGVSWSLDIELQFYLLLPLAAPLLAAPATRPALALAALAAAALTALGWALQLRLGLWTLLCYLPAFLAGALIQSRGWRASGRAAALSALAFLGTGLAVWSLPGLRPLLLRDIPSPMPEDIFGLGWTLLLAPFLAWHLRQPLARGTWIGERADRHLGNLSYTLYLVHWPVIDTLRHLLAPLGTGDKALILAAVAVATAAAYLAIDRPAERLRARLAGAAGTARRSGGARGLTPAE